MAVLDIQRRGQQIGRLRIGQQVSTGKKDKDGNDKMRPVRLDAFRFTTQSRPAADAVAALYGGEVRQWNGEYEIITRESAIGVTVPPRDQVVSQWYEMWTAGGCQRRCDSQREQISGGPCLCPHAADPDDEIASARAALERSALASQNPPKACKLVTRISVMLPDLPGLGVWRLDTGSYYAGVEIGDAAGLMQMARDKGVFLPAVLRIEHRQRVAGGQTKKFPVPVLEVTATFRDLATGAIEARGMTAQLPPAPGEQPKAITAGPAAQAAVAPLAERPDENDGHGPDPWDRATAIYQAALAAPTPDDWKACWAKAEREGLLDEQARIDREHPDEWTPLRHALNVVRNEKAQRARAAGSAA